MKINAVIIKTEDNDIEKVIARLEAQNVKPEEIYICEDNELLPEIMEKNIDCDYVFITQSDALPSKKDMLGLLLKRMQRAGDNTALVYGKEECRAGADILSQYRANYLFSDESYSGIEKAAETNNNISAAFCTNRCALYNMKWYEEIGGFPANSGNWQSLLYAAKAVNGDYDVVYEPAAKVIVRRKMGLGEKFKAGFEYGMYTEKFKYILRDYSLKSGELRYMLDALKYLIRREKYIFIFPLFVQTLVKYAGRELGRLYKHLPVKIQKMIMLKIAGF